MLTRKKENVQQEEYVYTAVWKAFLNAVMSNVRPERIWGSFFGRGTRGDGVREGEHYVKRCRAGTGQANLARVAELSRTWDEMRSEKSTEALADVALLAGGGPAHQKAAGPIPGQGTCLDCRFGPQ